MEESANARREWVGLVVSNKMNKTVVVEIERSVIHPLYRKVLRRVTKFKAHDEDNACKVGDRVRFDQSLVMKNFNSKTLNRTFDQIIFVNSATVVN